jgi:hypothetical protein
VAAAAALCLPELRYVVVVAAFLVPYRVIRLMYVSNKVHDKFQRL